MPYRSPSVKPNLIINTYRKMFRTDRNMMWFNITLLSRKNHVISSAIYNWYFSQWRKKSCIVSVSCIKVRYYRKETYEMTSSSSDTDNTAVFCPVHVSNLTETFWHFKTILNFFLPCSGDNEFNRWLWCNSNFFKIKVITNIVYRCIEWSLEITDLTEGWRWWSNIK